MRAVLIAMSLGLLFSVTGCATIASVAGIEKPKQEEVILGVGAVCDKCLPATHQTLSPFSSEEPLKYTKVGIAQVDTFVESANKLYFSVLLTEKMVGISKQMVEDPNTKIEGFEKPAEVIDLAKGLLEVAQKDAPALMESGTSLTTELPGIVAADPALALAADDAGVQLSTAIERLTEASGKLADIAASIAE